MSAIVNNTSCNPTGTVEAMLRYPTMVNDISVHDLEEVIDLLAEAGLVNSLQKIAFSDGITQTARELILSRLPGVSIH
jgi:hypothetical protein